jgi:signal transduction histidine kinase
MHYKLSLRSRFLLSMLTLVAVLCVAFGLTVHQFFELLEDEMLNRTLVREMQEFVQDFALHPDLAPASQAGLSRYIQRNSQDTTQLPAELVNLSEGVHEDVTIAGREYYAARQDTPSARLYLVLDTERTALLEDRVFKVAALSGAVALGLAALIAILLARTVTRPVTELAREVNALNPHHRDSQLHGRFADREIGIIAAALDNYLARLNSVLEREQAFTEDASHELRTPLSVIASATQLLAEEPALSARGQERLLRIRRACGQMQSLIEALLFLAREEDPAPSQSCALDEIVQAAADTARTMATEHHVGLDLQLEPVIVTAPPGMVACVVNNLVLNAINFTRQGLIEIHLTQTELMVRDTGVGIAPTELSHIFERRYRGVQSRGLGLGLYLVNRICDRLGWKIQADSTQGVGTTFRVQIKPLDIHTPMNEES